MKRLIRALGRRFGYDIVRRSDVPDRPLSVLPYLLAVGALAEPDFFFIQIGAHDGMRNDPLYESVVRHKLRGLLVEPLPDFFERLRANYAGHTGLQFEQAAVTIADGPVPLYRVRPDAPTPLWVQGIASLDRRHLDGRKFGVPELERFVEEISVSGLTFPSLLKRHGVNNVSLLQVDTEGFDCDVVVMALEAGIKPTVINYEYIHSSPAMREKVKRMLAQIGYEYLDIGRDTLAVRSGAWLPAPSRA